MLREIPTLFRLTSWDGTVSRNTTVIPPSPFQIRTAYQTYMKKIAKLLGGGFNSDAKMMEIYNFEKKLAQVRKRQTEPCRFIKVPWGDLGCLTKLQWFSVVWTFIYNDLRHHMVKMLCKFVFIFHCVSIVVWPHGASTNQKSRNYLAVGKILGSSVTPLPPYRGNPDFRPPRHYDHLVISALFSSNRSNPQSFSYLKPSSVQPVRIIWPLRFLCLDGGRSNEVPLYFLYYRIWYHRRSQRELLGHDVAKHLYALHTDYWSIKAPINHQSDLRM